MAQRMNPSSSSSSSPSPSWTASDDVRTTTTADHTTLDGEGGTGGDDPVRDAIVDLGRRSGGKNIIFANDGEEESEDEWDSDDDDDDIDDDEIDVDDIGFDANETVDSPFSDENARSGGEGGGTRGEGAAKGMASSSSSSSSSFVEDFRGTRVFVQGLPEEATWKDVSGMRRCYGASSSHLRPRSMPFFVPSFVEFTCALPDWLLFPRFFFLHRPLASSNERIDSSRITSKVA